jgi:Uma2 family endonuclease
MLLTGEERFLLRDISWGFYEAILAELDGRHVRLTYDRGNLELMTVSHPHEFFKNRIGRLVETLTEELDIEIMAGGSETFKREDIARGLEPDECYWIRNEPRVRGKLGIDLAIDPPPDLAIEVEISPSRVDRPGIYAALGIPELWRFNGNTFRIDHLQPDGTYREGPASLNFPLLTAAEIERFLLADIADGETRWARSFRAWVRNELAPRLPENP